MIVKDEQKAIKILDEIDYHRITAYALRFKENDNYNNKVSFKHMYRLY